MSIAGSSQAPRGAARGPRVKARLSRVSLLAAAVVAALASAGGSASAAATRQAACSVPGGARLVASVAGVLVWWQTAPSSPAVRRQYGRASYPVYSGCAPGGQPQVLFRDYAGDPVAVRVAGDYVGLLDQGGEESLYLSDARSGRTTSTTSFTASVQDNGGSEAYEPGPLLAWRVSPAGWLVYLDTRSDAEGYGTVLVAFTYAGATTLDLTPQSPTGASQLGALAVSGGTVSWRSSFSGAHRVTLGPALLPSAPPAPLPSACRLVPRSLARRLLGALSATSPPAPRVPPAGFWPRVGTGTGRSGCAYAAAADSAQTLAVTEQRVSAATVSRQQRATARQPRDDSALVLPGIAAVLHAKLDWMGAGRSAPEDLRLFIHGVEVDLVTSSERAASQLEAAGLAVERALRDAPGA